MHMTELVARCRSYRRFRQGERIGMEVLEHLASLARLTASAANMQPLRYVLVADSVKATEIYPTLGWAAYLKDWPGPVEGERPAAYVIILGEEKHRKFTAWDMGIAAQTILLGAVERGLGGCMIGNIDKPRLAGMILVPDGFEILLVLALGVPAETVAVESMGPEGDVRYWRDEANVHHVPKRSLEELVVGRY
ncbi:nitroreductase family protein [Desulfocurvibacter africanus]|uniref:nitroreductase family protein n=1 Tax=Desulfocurvibacter africanus TaxID=873 RepID=UPI00042A5FD1|nr:nitroreductase family protein [Desulfocurvibacter africanus]